MRTPLGRATARHGEYLGERARCLEHQDPDELVLRLLRTERYARRVPVAQSRAGRGTAPPGPPTGTAGPFPARRPTAGSGCGGWEIRTPEGLHPTRFPSERHRPLGESSSAASLYRAALGSSAAPLSRPAAALREWLSDRTRRRPPGPWTRRTGHEQFRAGTPRGRRG